MAYSSDRSGLFYDSRDERERMRPPEPRSHVSYADQPETTKERDAKSYFARSARDRDDYIFVDGSRFSTAQTVIDRDSEYVRPGSKRPSYVDESNPFVLPPRQRGPIPRFDPFDSLDIFQAWTLACEYDLRPQIASPFNPLPKPIDSTPKTKVAVTQQSLSQKSIKDDVQDLDRDMPLPQKLLRLTAEELQQVESLLEQKNAFEADSQYEWVVAQLNWFTSSSVFDSGAPKRRDSTMLYLKRTPKPHVNRGELHRQKNSTAGAEKPLPSSSYGRTGIHQRSIVVEDCEDEQDKPEPVKKIHDYIEAWVLANDKGSKASSTPNKLPHAFPQFMSQEDLNEAVSNVARNGKSIGKRMLRFKMPILAVVADLIIWKRKSETDSKYEWLLAEIEGPENDSDSDESGSDSESDRPRKHGGRKQSATVYLRRALKSGPVTQMRFEDMKQAKPPAMTPDAKTAQTQPNQEPSKPKSDPKNSDTPEKPIDKQDQPPNSPDNEDGRHTPLSRQSTYQPPPDPSTTAPAPKTQSTTESPIATPSSSRSRSNSENISHYQPSAAATPYSAPKPPKIHIAVASRGLIAHASGSEVVPPTNGGIRRRAGFAQEQPQRRESDVGLPIAEPSTHTNGNRRANGRARSTRSTGRATITRLFGSRSSLFQRTKRGGHGGGSDDENAPDPPKPLPDAPSFPPKTSRWTKACLLIFTLLLSFAFFIGGVSFDRTLAASSLPPTSNSSSLQSSSVDFLDVMVGCIWHILSVFFSYCTLIWHRRKLLNKPLSTINSLLGVELILLLAGTSGPITTGLWFRSVPYCKLSSLLGNALLAFANLAMIFLEESAEQKIVWRDKDIFMLQRIVVGPQNGEVMNGTAINGIRSEDSSIGQSQQITTATTRVGSSNGGSQCGGDAWDNVTLE